MRTASCAFDDTPARPTPNKTGLLTGIVVSLGKVLKDLFQHREKESVQRLST